MEKLKAYTVRFGLIKSKAIKNENDIKECLFELSKFTEIKAVFLTDGKSSKRINFTIQKQNTRPVYFVRSDGIRCHGLSIHPKNYPMIAFFADGTKKEIRLCS